MIIFDELHEHIVFIVCILFLPLINNVHVYWHFSDNSWQLYWQPNAMFLINTSYSSFCRWSSGSTQDCNQKFILGVFFLVPSVLSFLWKVGVWKRLYTAGFGAGTSVPKLSIVSATHNILNPTHSPDWPESAWPLKTLPEVTESETLASAAESWASSDCGTWKGTEEAAMWPSVTWNDLLTSDEFIIIVIILMSQFNTRNFT